MSVNPQIWPQQEDKIIIHGQYIFILHPNGTFTIKPKT